MRRARRVGVAAQLAAALGCAGLVASCASTQERQIAAAVGAARGDVHSQAGEAARAHAEAARRVAEECEPLKTKRLDPVEEETVGQQLMDALTAPKKGETRDTPPHQAATNAYLHEVGGRLAGHAQAADLHWVFQSYAATQPMVQWSLGGYVSASAAWVRTAKDETELAAGLAHAVAHAAAPERLVAYDEASYRACWMKVNFDAYRSVGRQELPADAAEWASESARSVKVLDLTLMELAKPATPAEEARVDAVAIGLLRDAGYEPSGYASAMEKLEATAEWKARHPPSPQRREAVEQALAETPAPAKGKKKPARPRLIPKELRE